MKENLYLTRRAGDIVALTAAATAILALAICFIR